MKKYRRNRRGSVSLESAIAFTITLVFLASIVSCIQYYRTDILMRRSVEQTCEKMSLLYPVSVPASDAMSAALNAFPDLGSGEMKGSQTLSKVVTYATGFDDLTGHTIEELILKGLFAQTMENQIMEAYIERNGGSTFFAPDDVEVFFEINDEHHIIEVTTEYSVVNLAGVKSRSIYSVIPLYGDPVLMLQDEDNSEKEGENSDENKNDIWSLSNFDRGDAIRELYGANLPKTFPVIDSVDGDDVTAIRSIDLTSPYYQDISHIEKKIKDDIRELSCFEPQSANINGATYTVDQIGSRYLKIVIPENSSELSKEKIDELKGYALVQGVILDISEYGTSEKYIE